MRNKYTNYSEIVINSVDIIVGIILSLIVDYLTWNSIYIVCCLSSGILILVLFFIPFDFKDYNL